MDNDNQLDDSWLVEQYKVGHKNALTVLVKRWHVKLCKQAYWYSKDYDAAKDIAQDSWKVIIDKIDNLKDSKRFGSWALSIMKNKIEKIDEIIKDALTKEEAKFYDELEEQNLFQLLGGVFKGKLGWLVVIMNIVIVVVFGLFIYCAIQFFNTEETNELIRWSVAGTFCMIAISLLKLFVWMQMDKNSIIREMKRLEFQVSVLSSKLSN